MIEEKEIDQLKKEEKKTIWQLPRFPDVKGIDQVAIDLETYDPEIKDCGPGYATNKGYVVGVAVSFEGFDGYFPIKHERGANHSEQAVKNWLKALFKEDPIAIFHNAIYDLGWLRWWGIECTCTKIYDTLLAAPLIDENRFNYKLDSLAKDYLGERKQFDLLEQFSKEHGFKAIEKMHLVPSDIAGRYAEQDTRLTYRLWEVLRTELQKQNLIDIFNLETELLPIILEMKWKGVRIDLERAEKTKKFFSEEEKKIYRSITKETGIKINEASVWTPSILQQIFDKVGEKYAVTEKNKQIKIVKDDLRESENPIIRNLALARELNKAHTTFVDSYIKFAVDGRIHAEINQLKKEDNRGTVSGRLSMSYPNLQQVPSRNPLVASKIRSLFLPEEGEQWASLDYSQQEPRLLVHYAKKHDLEGADDMVKFFDDGKDFHQVTAEMAGISRKEAKTVGLSLMYGQGTKALASNLESTEEEALALKKKYNSNVSFLKSIMNKATRHAEQQGYINTLLGRKCRFNLWTNRDWSDKRIMVYENAIKEWSWNNIQRAGTYKALNRIIQGSAADQTKTAMVNLRKQVGVIPMIQIHDELNVSIANETQVKEIKEIMETAVELHVPVKCEVKIGKNWGEAE
jgi:DNA polymerase I-like protein with 3'-5' exonuclease and polymerase domains